MITDRGSWLALAGAALLLSGCAEHSMLERPGDAAFGEANRQTMMAQVIDPDPVYSGDATSSGETAAAAVERYRQGKVEQPDSIRTTDVGGDNGSSGGSTPRQ